MGRSVGGHLAEIISCGGINSIAEVPAAQRSLGFLPWGGERYVWRSSWVRKKLFHLFRVEAPSALRAPQRPGDEGGHTIEGGDHSAIVGKGVNKPIAKAYQRILEDVDVRQCREWGEWGGG